MVVLIFLYYFCIFSFIAFCCHLHYFITYVGFNLVFSLLLLSPPLLPTPLLLLLFQFLRWKEACIVDFGLFKKILALKTTYCTLGTLLTVSYRFWCFIFMFIQLEIFTIACDVFLHELFRSMFFNFQIFDFTTEIFIIVS